jgi:hypothetical protein
VVGNVYSELLKRWRQEDFEASLYKVSKTLSHKHNKSKRAGDMAEEVKQEVLGSIPSMEKQKQMKCILWDWPGDSGAPTKSEVHRAWYN